MNEENVVLVVLIVIGVIILANGLMFLAARAWVRGGDTTRNLFDSTRDTFSRPFQQQDKSLEELRSQVEKLQNAKQDEQKSGGA